MRERRVIKQIYEKKSWGLAAAPSLCPSPRGEGNTRVSFPQGGKKKIGANVFAQWISEGNHI